MPARRSWEGRRTRGHPRGVASPCCSGTASGLRGLFWVRFLLEPRPWIGLHGENIPPIRNVTAWLSPHSQGAPRKERCTRLLILLTLRVLPVWLTLQRLLTWKREVGLTSHTLTLTSQSSHSRDAQHGGTRKGLGVVTKPASLNHKQKQSDSKWGGKKCLIK